jgi:hypothetical protein
LAVCCFEVKNMNIQDIILLIIVASCALAAILSIFKNKNDCCCNNCSMCHNCSKCKSFKVIDDGSHKKAQKDNVQY